MTLIMAGALIGAFASDAGAVTAEPTITDSSWYWQEAKTQEISTPAGTVTVETPNPFCPGPGNDLGAPEQTCAQGRLPIEIQKGDYDNPDKLSAVNFDFSLVPIGSTVNSFTVTFLEAKTGCYDNDDDPNTPPQCEQTDPVNVTDKKLRACLVGQVFGSGAARQYSEVPDYECTGADPIAERKSKDITHKDGTTETINTWTFDLTPYAQEWVKSFTVKSAVMLTGQPPATTGDPQDTWRVVLAGAKFPNGVKTKLDYDEPADATNFPPGPTDGSSDGFSSGGTTTTTSGGGFSSGSGSFTGGTGTDTTGTASGTGAPATQPSPGAATQPTSATGDIPDVESFPAYMWLAILAGIVGFALVRSMVVESAAGPRPGGVLSQITSLNAQRRGTAAVAPTGDGGTMLGALRSIGGKAAGLGRKLNPFRRG